MNNLSPELWVAKFIKSATNGKTVSIRIRRILTLISIPIWLLGLVWIAPIFYEGCKSVHTYNTIKIQSRASESNYHVIPPDARKEIIRRILINSHPMDTLTDYEYKIIEGEVPVPDWVMDEFNKGGSRQDELDEAKAGMFNMLSLPLYALIFFVIPWVVLRLIFWIADTDKAKELG